MMKNKKASHVGVILSFVIFVTFLIFLFSILGSPIKLPSNKEPLIDYLKVELTQKFSSNLTIVTIALGSPAGKDCVEIPNTIYNFSNLYLVVKNKSDNIVASKHQVGVATIDWSGGESFYKIFYSEDALDVPGSFSCSDPYTLQLGNISSVRKSEYFNTDKIDDFFSNYTSDYDALKAELNVPQNTEFGLSFTNATEDTISTEEIDAAIDIFSREIPIQYFDKSANVNSGFINIKVW